MLKINRKVSHFQNIYYILTTKISDSFFLLPADKLQDREKLFEGGTNNDDLKPRLRKPEEIMATYRKTEVMLSWLTFPSFKTIDFNVLNILINAWFQDAASVAAQARNKLMERHEKLEVEICLISSCQLALHNFYIEILLLLIPY